MKENKKTEERYIKTEGGNFIEKLFGNYIQGNVYNVLLPSLPKKRIVISSLGILLTVIMFPAYYLLINTLINRNPGQAVKDYSNPNVLPLQQGMPYEEARQKLIDAGWQTIFNRFATAASRQQTEFIVNKKGWTELVSCEGAGLGLCAFEFKDAAGRNLRIVTANNSPETNSSELKNTVFQWFLVEEEGDNL